MKSTIDYCVLSKDERLTLYLKAASRDDKQEMQRVIAASPRVEMKLVDFSADLRRNERTLECSLLFGHLMR
ncbi:MAG TPA: hypothetical protein DC054_14895 [Blastocatellia bacterium]|nr:hypothetical protein [Blastocatellia bacterium]